MSKDKNKLSVITKVEKEMFDLMNIAVERGIDTALMWASRNKLDVDGRILDKICDLVRNSCKDTFLSQVERTNRNISVAIDPYVRDDEDPLS